MIQKLTIALIFSFVFSAHGRAPSTYAQLKSDLDRVPLRSLVETMNSFIKASAPSRMVGSPGHEKAKAFIQEMVTKYDSKNKGKFTVLSTPVDIEAVKSFYQKDFDEKVEGKVPKSHPEYQKWLGVTAYMKNFAESKKSFPVENLIWEKAGLNSNKVLVITAHYDTISQDKDTFKVKENEPMPGANYNASGVAVALSLIRVMAEMDLNYSVKVVFLDWQGIGFHGSEVYAKELKKSNEVMGVINLEMLGQDTSFFDKTKKTGNMSVYFRDLSDEARWVKKLIDHGSKVNQKVTFEAKARGFENSDNFRFWEQGFFSATFTQNWEDDFNPKFYQTAQDTSETLNHETLWNSYQYIGGAVLGSLLDLTK